jgi:hypothetical protein
LASSPDRHQLINQSENLQMTTSATFVGVKAGMDFGGGLHSDGQGVMTVPTGFAGGTSNAGDAVMAAIRAGGIPLPVQTAGYTTARAAAVTAIAAVASTPTGAEVQAALNAVLATISAMFAE